MARTKLRFSQLYVVENLMRQPLPGLWFLSASRLIFSVILLLGLASHVAFAQAPLPVETTMKNMLSAIQSESLSDFVASGDSAFQSGMTQQMLDSISQSLSHRLKQGYAAKFLTELSQQGFMIYLWKLEFKDNNDDVLATMAVKDGKVSAFWLR